MNVPLHQGDIVLVPFPFSDLSSAKMRPALVVSNSTLKGQDLIVCAITSQRGSRQATSFSREDLSSGDLPLDSFVRFSKVVSLDRSIIRKKVATLKTSKLSEVLKGLKGLF